MSIAPNDSDRAASRRDSLARVMMIAPTVTFVLAVVSVLTLVTLVPRRDIGGGRSVPEIAWPTYALVGNFVPFAVSIVVLAFLFRTSRHRILAWIISGITCYITHEMFVTNLLRRDFIGKF